MIVPIDPNVAKPIYLQIADHITAMARSGQLGAEDRLPSSRQLAEQLGVHRSTVVNAYDELESRGVVRGVHGSGSYIESGIVDTARTSKTLTVPNTSPDGERIITQLWQVNRAEGIISLALGAPADESFPVETFEQYRQRMLKRDGAYLFAYSEPQGFAPLRQAIAHYLAQQGIKVDAQDIIVTAGAQEALALVDRALAQAGDSVIVEAPGFFGTWLSLRRLGLQLMNIGITADGPDWESLEQLDGQTTHPRFIVISPDFQNPTGTQWSAEDRYRFLKWAAEHEIQIIEDATYRDLPLTSVPLVPLRALEPNVLYIGTFSKSLMPGLRMGFIVANGLLRNQLVTLKRISSGSNETSGQYALAEYLMSGSYAAHLEQVNTLYLRRRTTAIEALHAYFPPSVTWTVPQGSFYLWITLPDRWPVLDFFYRALKQGIAIAPSTVFYSTATTVNAFRICFARYPDDVLVFAIRTLASLLTKP